MLYLRGFFVIERIPKCVIEILETLESHGYISYLVGGCVRDLLMQREPKDWDICTPATPKELKKIFISPIVLGEKFGTIGVQTQVGIVEITTFREELRYVDFRHPQVAFVLDLEKDLKRRDFTINAMAYHPREGVVDLFGGRRDLERKILRCVGDVHGRFQEDALRILRLVRFSCTLGFEPEQKSLQIALQDKNLLRKIAHERIGQELIQILQGDYLHLFFKPYREIFSLVLPELQAPKKNAIKNLSLRLAFLFDHVEAIRRLGIAKNLRARAEFLVANKNRVIKEDLIELKMCLKEMGYDHLMALLELKKLNGENTKKLYSLVQMIMINDECFCLKDLQIKGSDLLKLGISGKMIGEILERLLDEVIRGEICNTFEALHNRATYLSCMLRI